MEIGQKVKWTPNHGKQCRGIFREYKDNFAIVICYQMGDIQCHLKVEVVKELLQLDET